MTESELRALICRSEKEGFRALFREYRAYVYTVIWNRRQCCRRGGNQAHEPGESLPEDLPDGSDVSEAGEHAVLRQQLLRAIESLGQPDASIILQKYYYDRSYNDIAWSLRMAPAAVRMRAGRALKRLKTLLGDAFDPEGGAR